MTATAKKKVYNPARDAYPDYLEIVRERQQALRRAGVHADDRIWPQTPIGRELFAEGITVAAFVGPPSGRPSDHVHALAELLCCLKHGIIKVTRNHDEALPAPH